MKTAVRFLAWAILYILALGVSGFAVYAYGFRPLGAFVHPEMAAFFRSQPWAIYTHVFASVAALAFGPIQFSARLRIRYPQFHRNLGKIYLGVGVLVGGLAGLYMAFHAFGGIISKLGFGCLAVSWLVSGGLAYTSIRRGDIESHRRWMIRNFALTFAAVTLRLYLGLVFANGFPFEPAYRAISWLCWVPNLLLAEWLFVRRR